MQARASWARVTGMSDEDIERYIWEPHNVWAGEELYGICIGLRGFYMKVTVHLRPLPRITAFFSHERQLCCLSVHGRRPFRPQVRCSRPDHTAFTGNFMAMHCLRQPLQQGALSVCADVHGKWFSHKHRPSCISLHGVMTLRLACAEII